MSIPGKAPKAAQILAAILGSSLSLAAYAGPARSVKVISTPEVQDPYAQHVASTSTFNRVTAAFDAVPEGQTLFITDISLRTALIVRGGNTFAQIRECVLELRDFSETIIFSRYIPVSSQFEEFNFNGANSLAVAADRVSVFASAGETPVVNCIWTLNGEGPSLDASLAGYTVTGQ